MSLIENLAKLLTYVEDLLVGFPGLLSPEQLDLAGKPDAWSPKDILFHNLEWADRRLVILETLERGEVWTNIDYGDFDDANRVVFEEHRDKSWEDVQARISNTFSGIADYLDRVSEEVLLSSREGEDRTIWRSIADSYVLHPMIHVWGYLVENGYKDKLASIFGGDFVDLLLKLDDSDTWRGLTYYNQACIQALNGDLERSLSTLTNALKLNQALVEWSQQDADLEAIRGLPEYAAIYDELEKSN
jgi:hypothetical protein